MRGPGEGLWFEARGTEEEILQKAAPHAKEAHGMEVTPDLVAAVRGAIEASPRGRSYFAVDQ